MCLYKNLPDIKEEEAYKNSPNRYVIHFDCFFSSVVVDMYVSVICIDKGTWLYAVSYMYTIRYA